MDEIKLVSYDEVFLDKSWEWLNDSEIKELTDTPNYTKDSQLIWFNSLPFRNDYKIWGVTYNTIPIGVFGIKNITEYDGEYWGYIGEKEYWGKGLGTQIIERMLLIASTDLNLSSIYLFVLEYNKRAIRLYNKLGFKIVDNNSTRIKMSLKLR